jgi:putative endonuclease
MAWIYIVECADGFYYTGSTVDLERRLWEHNQGIGANFTKKRLPVKLVFAEQSDSVETAFIREKQVQGWSRAKKLALIEGRWADLPGLAKRGPSMNSGTEVAQGPT